MIRVVLNKAISDYQAPLNFESDKDREVSFPNDVQFVAFHRRHGDKSYRVENDEMERRIKDALQPGKVESTVDVIAAIEAKAKELAKAGKAAAKDKAKAKDKEGA